MELETEERTEERTEQQTEQRTEKGTGKTERKYGKKGNIYMEKHIKKHIEKHIEKHTEKHTENHIENHIEKHTENHIKKLILAGATALSLAVSVTGCGTSAPKTQLEPITVILDYVANTNHTGMYVALNQGYYGDLGLDVKIIEPTQGATATLIATGKGDFGISYQEDVTVARTSADPLPIKAIAAIIQHNTSGFATYGEKAIVSPKDFEGKTYAGWGGPGEEAVLKAVMTQAGGDFSKLNMVISDGSGFEALKDKADIMWFFEAWDNVKCKMNNFPLHYQELRQLDERLDYYTPVIIASDNTLAQKPETVRKFLEATEKGYRFAMDNPGEAAKILQTYAPDYDLEMLSQSQEYLASKYMEDTERWGVMADHVWDRYTNFLVEYGVIEGAIPAEECYTNEFLPK